MKSEYQTRADDFLRRIGATVSVAYIDTEIVPDWDDNALHDTYLVMVERDGKKWRYEFHDSVYKTRQNKERIHCGKSRIKPSAYDVLSCVEKYDVGSIDNFMDEFGYEIHKWADVKKIERIYAAVCDEVHHVQELFGDVIDEFAEVFC